MKMNGDSVLLKMTVPVCRETGTTLYFQMISEAPAS